MKHVRSILDVLYLASGALAGVFLVVILILVMAQIISRLFGTIVPSADDFAGYSMMAATFLALAYTFRHGGHVRVTLLVTNLQGWRRAVAEIAALAIAIVVIGYFLWFAIDLTWQSYVFGDLSYGLVPIPLWIPQSCMAFGILVLMVALLDDLVVVVRGQSPRYQTSEAASKLAAEDEALEARRQAREANRT